MIKKWKRKAKELRKCDKKYIKMKTIKIYCSITTKCITVKYKQIEVKIKILMSVLLRRNRSLFIFSNCLRELRTARR